MGSLREHVPDHGGRDSLKSDQVEACRSPNDSADVDFRASVDRPTASRFEPVRLSLAVVNNGSESLDLYCDPYYTKIETTLDGDLLRLRVTIPSLRDVGPFRFYAGPSGKLRLAPGERISVSMPVVAGEILRDDGYGGLPRYVVPIGRRAGEHLLRCEYPLRGSPQRTTVAADAAFSVTAAPEKFAPLTAKLEADDSLCRALVDHHQLPAPAHRKVLASIVEGESIYADYARFALARMAMGYDGTARSLLSDEPTLNAAEDEYYRLVPRDPDAAAKYCRKFTYHPLRTDVEIDGAIGDVVSSLAKGDDDRLAAARRLALLRFATKADLESAENWLKGIRSELFPYRPDVLIMLWHVHRRNRSPQAEQVEAELDAKFADAVEWLYFKLLKVEDSGPISRSPFDSPRPPAKSPAAEPEKRFSLDDWTKFRIRRTE
jgi:hypothetical protein